MNEVALSAILRKLGIHDLKRQRSGWLDFHCPLAPYTHASGTDRSMSAGAKINDSGLSAWVCHACKHHGRISSLVRQVARFTGKTITGLAMEADLAETLPALSADFGDFETSGNEESQSPLQDAAYSNLFPKAWDVPQAQTYLISRGISESTSQTLELVYDDEQARILFPVRDYRNDLWGYSGRAIRPEIKPKIRDYYGLPKRKLILGEHRWQQGKPTLIVEGLFGYAHLVEQGVESLCNVGATLGSVMTAEKAARLASWDTNVFLLFDNDEAGDVGLFGSFLSNGKRDPSSSAIQRLIGYVPVYVPSWPESKADPDQLTYPEVADMLTHTALFS